MDTGALLKRGIRLEYLTLGWNVVGVVVVAIAAIAASSVALAGFGLDSLIEIFASVVVVWQLKGARQETERRAMRMIGAAFFALSIYVLVQASYVLITERRPEPSTLGILWLGATVVAMLTLARGKQITGMALGNPVLITEARVTIVDGVLAAAVLVGLLLNAAFGWSWADPIASLAIVYYGLREGRAAWADAGT